MILEGRIEFTDKNLIARCEQYGHDIVDSFKRGENRGSLAVAGDRGIERDPVKQGWARMAECSACFYFGLPMDGGHIRPWTPVPDEGWDIGYRKWLMDIKHTPSLRHQYLVWSRDANQYYAAKRFDILVLVKGRPPLFHVRGWIGKQDFYDESFVAGAEHPLEPGTWAMHEERLEPMRLLKNILEKRRTKLFDGRVKLSHLSTA